MDDKETLKCKCHFKVKQDVNTPNGIRRLSRSLTNKETGPQIGRGRSETQTETQVFGVNPLYVLDGFVLFCLLDKSEQRREPSSGRNSRNLIYF